MSRARLMVALLAISRLLSVLGTSAKAAAFLWPLATVLTKLGPVVMQLLLLVQVPLVATFACPVVADLQTEVVVLLSTLVAAVRMSEVTSRSLLASLVVRMACLVVPRASVAAAAVLAARFT